MVCCRYIIVYTLHKGDNKDDDDDDDDDNNNDTTTTTTTTNGFMVFIEDGRMRHYRLSRWCVSMSYT